MRHRLDAAGVAAAFPDHRVGEAARLRFRTLVDTVQGFEQVAGLFLLGDFQQIQGLRHGALLSFRLVVPGFGAAPHVQQTTAFARSRATGVRIEAGGEKCAEHPQQARTRTVKARIIAKRPPFPCPLPLRRMME